jgi:gamma-glutamyltranspeptidase / glutathione hydrolase
MTEMNPAQWPKGEVDHYLALSRSGREYKSMVGESDRSMVIGSTGPFAQYCGVRALKAGGTAVDAAVVTSFAQVVLAAGAWVSMAGIAGMVIFDPKTREVHSVNGPYKTFRDETEPLTIPATPSGRSALVPGYFASIFAAHQRFGKLSWTDVLTPAIWLADNGIPVNDILLATMPGRKPVLERLPETREIFFPNGEDVFKEGGWFKQPLLAGTLRKVGKDGPDYIYRGEWAKQFVERVSAEGGKVQISDLADYKPVWSKALSAKAYGHEVFSLGAPENGGYTLIEGLRLLEALEVNDPVADGESLYWFTQVILQSASTRETSREARLTDAEIKRTADAMREKGGAVPPSKMRQGSHSDYVVAADSSGMMIAMCHTINSMMWGSTGINVGGISIPDSASFQQRLLSTMKPGDYMPNVTNPNIVFKNGKPVLASSSIGTGLMQTTLQCLHAFLALGMSVNRIVDHTLIHGWTLGTGDSVTSGGGSDGGKNMSDVLKSLQELGKRAAAECSDPEDQTMYALRLMAVAIQEGAPAKVLADARGRGVQIEEMANENPLLPRGFWGAISLDPQTKRLLGARTAGASGQVIGT